MQKTIKYLAISYAIIISSIVAITVLFSTFFADNSKTWLVERAYFEGQRDAINGDVRIVWNWSTSQWEWQRSPWNDSREPVFDPTTVKTKE